MAELHRNAIEAHYDTKSESYDSARQSLVFKIYDAITWKYLEPYVPSNPNSLVLDAGGGSGRWAVPMAKKGCKVVLVDISEKMLEIAQKKVEAEGLSSQIEVRKADIGSLDYPDETFDFVLSEHTLFLFEKPERVVAELVRVLKKNAPLVLSAQNRLVQTLAHLPEDMMENPTIAKTAKKVLNTLEHDFLSKQPPIKIFSLTPTEFRGILEKNGLEIERMLPKIVTMPLRFAPDFFMKKDVPEELIEDIFQLELAFSEHPDAIPLGAHLQAMARKK